MTNIIDYIVKNNLGDIASVIGVIVAIIGFFVTISNVVKSKNAAQKAEAASYKIRENIFRYDAISECAEAISLLNEIKRLQRGNLWLILPDRYSAVNRLLYSLKAFDSELMKNHKMYIQNAIQQFVSLEELVDRSITRNKLPPSESIVQINKIVNQQLDKLYEIQSFLKHQMI
ncbi:hypothetical protein QUF90_23415 [Desulfococcaceae bacterium HSG9]|nr:hypothetical protein [Desulfococcaceae bacterium HSG9]